MVPLPPGASGPLAEPALKELFSEGALRGFGHEQRCLKAQGQRLAQCQALSALTQDPALLRSARGWRLRDCGKQGCGGASGALVEGPPTGPRQAGCRYGLRSSSSTRPYPQGSSGVWEGPRSPMSSGALGCRELRNWVNMSFSHPGGKAELRCLHVRASSLRVTFWPHPGPNSACQLALVWPRQEPVLGWQGEMPRKPGRHPKCGEGISEPVGGGGYGSV